MDRILYKPLAIFQKAYLLLCSSLRLGARGGGVTFLVSFALPKLCRKMFCLFTEICITVVCLITMESINNSGVNTTSNR